MKLILTLAILFYAGPAFAQCVPAVKPPITAPVKNPRSVEFQCPDHDKDTGHDLELRDASGTVLAVIPLGDPVMGADCWVVAPINVQPIDFSVGNTAVTRSTYEGGISSVNSEVSNVWERVPGAPSKPRVQ
jgi:hypothetical protein